MIIETATLSEADIAAYRRKKSVYPERITQWKQAFLQVPPVEDRAALKQIHKENKQLKKELVRKEKALPEAAAILALRKRLRDYYGETDGDD